MLLENKQISRQAPDSSDERNSFKKNIQTANPKQRGRVHWKIGQQMRKKNTSRSSNSFLGHLGCWPESSTLRRKNEQPAVQRSPSVGRPYKPGAWREPTRRWGRECRTARGGEGARWEAIDASRGLLSEWGTGRPAPGAGLCGLGCR